MSSNGNDKKDKKATGNGNGNGRTCWYDMSNLTDLWNRHATKVVLVVLLLILVVWYRKEVTETVSSAASTATSTVGSAIGKVSETLGLSSSEAAQAGVVPAGAVLSAQVAPGELAGNVPTASEIRQLFNF